jgi:hypothetical protein
VDQPAAHPDTSGFVSSENWSPARSPLALDNEMTVADWWFAGLDQRPLVVNGVRWTTQVVGVHLNRFGTWIQIEFAEHRDSSLLLQLPPLAALHDAIAMIRDEIIRTGV